MHRPPLGCSHLQTAGRISGYASHVFAVCSSAQVRQRLLENVKTIYSAFFYYCSASAWNLDPSTTLTEPLDNAYMTYESFVLLAVELELVDTLGCPMSAVEEVFHWAQTDEHGIDLGIPPAMTANATASTSAGSPNVGQGDEEMRELVALSGSSHKNDILLSWPEGLLRYQFLRAVIRIAMLKIYALGVEPSPAQAVDKLFVEQITKLLPSEVMPCSGTATLD